MTPDPAVPWTIAVAPGTLRPEESIFLCGLRSTAEIRLATEGLGRTALSPLDALNTLSVRLDPAPILESVTVSPVVITKTWRYPDGGRVETSWRVDAVHPLVQAVFTFHAAASAPLVCRVHAEVVSNVGWINKFAQHDDDTGVAGRGELVFRDKAKPELELRVWTNPAGEATLDAAPHDRPDACAGTLTVPVGVRAGRRATVTLAVAATDRAKEMRVLRRKRGVADTARTLTGAFTFRSPDSEIDEFLRACCATMTLNVRELPFGAPYAAEAGGNTRLPVVTASPDYHGIFANDCIQTLWEGGLLGPTFRQAAIHSVDAMFRYGPVESVEWWTGDGKTWCFPFPLGDTPQIVSGACRHLLWTGDRALADRWWPDILRCLAILPANDADGDDLEDRRNTPYPEQPNPGEYDHEMLHVQCFWRQAYTQAARVAVWSGRSEATELAARAARIGASIESKFGTPYGLGVWLNKAHQPHPHIGHEQIIAAAEGDVSDERARLIVKTATTPPIWTPDGPLRAEPGKGVSYGDHVWTFMRWKLVHALLRLGEVDRGLEIARGWAAQERAMRYQAPEGFPTITGTTGKAYTWSAGRALRALVFGLTGMDLEADGVRFKPRLPSGWDTLDLSNIRIHGASVDLAVRRGSPRVSINGRAATDAAVPYGALGRHCRVEVWTA